MSLFFSDNPRHKLPSDTLVSYEFPREQLPGLSRGYKWITVIVPVRKRIYTGKYYYKTVRRHRKRVYTFYYRTYKQKFWGIEKIKRPPKRGRWVKSRAYEIERMRDVGIDYDEVEFEKSLPFDFVDRDNGFTWYKTERPERRTFDLMFLYYIFSMYKLKEERLIYTSSSFDLDGFYTLEQIERLHVPAAIEVTKERFEGRGRKANMRFVAYIGYSAVTKHELDEGK